VVDYNYYCEVTYDRADIRPGVYSFSSEKNSRIGYNRLITLSDKVWRQGPKGGVKILKDRNSYHRHTQYVTTSEKLMKKFMWVKLQAQPYIKGA
jgi:hypothetical protein